MYTHRLYYIYRYIDEEEPEQGAPESPYECVTHARLARLCRLDDILDDGISKLPVMSKLICE